MKDTDIPAGLRQSVSSLVYKYAMIRIFSPINACILRILSHKLVTFDMQIKVEELGLL